MRIPPERQVADRMLGAKLVAVSELGDGLIGFDFEHRGTDDNAGAFHVHWSDVTFFEDPRDG